MGISMIPTTIALGEKYTKFSSEHCIYIKNYTIEARTLLNNSANSLDPFDYHVLGCGEKAFEEIEHNVIHTYYQDEDGDQDQDQDVDEDIRKISEKS